MSLVTVNQADNKTKIILDGSYKPYKIESDCPLGSDIHPSIINNINTESIPMTSTDVFFFNIIT